MSPAINRRALVDIARGSSIACVGRRESLQDCRSAPAANSESWCGSFCSLARSVVGQVFLGSHRFAGVVWTKTSAGAMALGAQARGIVSVAMYGCGGNRSATSPWSIDSVIVVLTPAKVGSLKLPAVTEVSAS